MRPGWHRGSWLLVAGALVMAACGSSAGPSASPSTAAPAPSTTTPVTVSPVAHVPEPKGCLPGIQHLLGQAERTPVRLTGQTRATDVVVCRFAAAHPAQPRCTTAAVMVNTDPQPYTDFNRWEVEAAQNVAQNSHPNQADGPHVVFNIGEVADWVPGHQLIEAVNTTRWVSVQLHCPVSAHPFTLAKTLVRAALVDPVGRG